MIDFKVNLLSFMPWFYILLSIFHSSPPFVPLSLTSCPAERGSSSWSCRWWGRPTGQPRCWRRSWCGRWIQQSSSARTSARLKRTLYLHLHEHGHVQRVCWFVFCPRSLPTAVHSCPPGRWIRGRPSWFGCPPGSPVWSRSPPKSQNRWKNHQEPGSSLETKMCKGSIHHLLIYFQYSSWGLPKCYITFYGNTFFYGSVIS